MLHIKRGAPVSTFPLESMRRDWYRAANVITGVRLLLFWLPGVLLLAAPTSVAMRWWSLVAFLVIALTDGLDGWVARRYNQITEWGKFLDPLVDKFLVVTTLIAICIVYPEPLLIAAAALVIAREIIVTLQIRTRGKLVAASWSGKVKMVAQVVMICAWLMPLEGVWAPARIIFTAFAVIMTIYSWWRYYDLFVRKG